MYDKNAVQTLPPFGLSDNNVVVDGPGTPCLALQPSFCPIDPFHKWLPI